MPIRHFFVFCRVVTAQVRNKLQLHFRISVCILSIKVVCRGEFAVDALTSTTLEHNKVQMN